jgi:hypothetical protein
LQNLLTDGGRQMADGRRQTVDGGGSAEKKISSKIIFFIDKKF